MSPEPGACRGPNPNPSDCRPNDLRRSRNHRKRARPPETSNTTSRSSEQARDAPKPTHAGNPPSSAAFPALDGNSEPGSAMLALKRVESTRFLIQASSATTTRNACCRRRCQSPRETCTDEVLLQRINMYFWIRSSPLIVPNKLHSLVVVVTGATNGIGYYTARELAFAGAHVVMACRRVDGAKEIIDRWEEEAENRQRLNLEVMELDLLSLNSVRQFGTHWADNRKPLHILINNAGILLLGESRQFSGDGLEKHIQVNHISPALLTVLLLPSLLAPNSARIINVNSVAHKWGSVEPKSWYINTEDKAFSSMKAYGSSKLVNLMFLKALSRKLTLDGKNSILCVAVHPGIVATNLLSEGGMRGIWMMHSSEGARNVLLAATGSEIEVNSDGFAYYNQNGRGRTSYIANDMLVCRRVWDETMSILGRSPDFSF